MVLFNSQNLEFELGTATEQGEDEKGRGGEKEEEGGGGGQEEEKGRGLGGEGERGGGGGGDKRCSTRIIRPIPNETFSHPKKKEQ
ncbi:hypothetical protein M8J75_004955 [Diaphorina citri]|nr:hypothetical protein M8J75_004955 [Diaphorina citri]KAI5727780.1 hypothetical protein M8J77_006831 [Diaphorina citri]